MIRLLLIKPSSLGDIIHSIGAAEMLARVRADVELTWLANEEYADFVKGLPGVSRVIAFPRRRLRWARAPLAGWVFARWLIGFRRRRYDIAVDLQGLQRSGLLARLSGARERFGPSDAREFARVHYNVRIRIPPGLRHAVDRVEYLAREVLRRSRFLGGSEPPLPPRTRLEPPEAARREARRLKEHAGSEKALLALAPGTRWPSKLWPAERWGELVSLLAARRPELRPVLIGSPAERPLARAVLSHSPPGSVEDLTGRLSLWETAALLAECRAAVTVDSAPLHLAERAGTPTVALFGPTDPLRVAPRGDVHEVVRLDLDCLCCYERRCPLPRRRCLPDLEPGRVLEALDRVLARSAAR